MRMIVLAVVVLLGTSTAATLTVADRYQAPAQNYNQNKWMSS